MTNNSLNPLPKKSKLHPRNKHNNGYNFTLLCELTPELKAFVFTNKYNNQTIDFSNNEAVLLLNKSLLKTYYNITYWSIPNGGLCPPIPGRADYIHYLADLLKSTNNNKIPHKETIKVLDVGTGANCIYPIIGSTQYQWDFVGTDINQFSVASAKEIVSKNISLKNKVEIRKQNSSHFIFKDIINKDEVYDLTLCNPPFHRSAEEADKGSQRKWNNLKKDTISNKQKSTHLNFGGHSNELWCDGGELTFIKKMITESLLFSSQVLWFSCLVSKKEHVHQIQLMLKKMQCSHIKIINMEQGQKISRFIAWSFLSLDKRQQWCINRFS